MLEFSCLATAGVYPSWRQYIMLRKRVILTYYYSSRQEMLGVFPEKKAFAKYSNLIGKDFQDSL